MLNEKRCPLTSNVKRDGEATQTAVKVDFRTRHTNRKDNN